MKKCEMGLHNKIPLVAHDNERLKKMPPRGLPLGGLSNVYNSQLGGFEPVYSTYRPSRFLVRDTNPKLKHMRPQSFHWPERFESQPHEGYIYTYLSKFSITGATPKSKSYAYPFCQFTHCAFVGEGASLTYMVTAWRLELQTHGLKARCSTNWAKRSCCQVLYFAEKILGENLVGLW